VRESSITTKLTRLVRSLLGKKEENEKIPKPLDLVNTGEDGLPLEISFVSALPIPLGIGRLRKNSSACSGPARRAMRLYK
jgi:hypothetical protein